MTRKICNKKSKQVGWVITKCNLEHSKCMSIQTTMSANMIAKVIDSQNISVDNANINNITTSVKTFSEIDVSTKVDRRKISRAIKISQSNSNKLSFVEDFMFLEDYVVKLLENNQNSTIIFEKLNGNKFYRLFVQMSAWVRKTIFSRPIGSYDSAFFKNYMWNGYRIMVFGVIDGENRIVLTSIAIVSSENMENYEWFMKCQQKDKELEAWLQQPGFTFTTDRDKGLKSALAKTFNFGWMLNCTRHLQDVTMQIL